MNKLVHSTEDLPRCHCSQDCLRTAFPDHLDQIARHRNDQLLLKHTVQKVNALTYMTMNTDPTTRITDWRVLGNRVCSLAWGNYMALPERTLREYTKLFHDGVLPSAVFHGNLGQMKPSTTRSVS